MLKRFLYITGVAIVFATPACKKQLNVGNPNEPTLDVNVTNETGIIALAQGGVYINGFYNGDSWLGDSYFSLPWGYAELLADNVGADAANQQISGVGLPLYYKLDDGTRVDNTVSQRILLRSYNSRAATGQGNNVYYYQWLNMYAMNNMCNIVLSRVDAIPFEGDAAARANTIKAWCYWWKGYAYASIGSMYYSGLISDIPNFSADPAGTNNLYLLHDAIIAESDNNFNKAKDILGSIGSLGDYEEVLGRLIPAFCQVDHGGVLTPDMWIRNINTMLARNILLNKLAPFVNGDPNASITGASIPEMGTSDWQNVLNLATNGIKESDYVFTGQTLDVNGFFTPSGGSVAALTTGVNTSSTFEITERFVQNFKAGDKRFDNNFDASTTHLQDFVYTTRYSVIDGGNGMPGVYVYGNNTVGEYELYIAGSYEENALMLAEANIRTGNIDDGLNYIDDVRDYQGAGVAHVSGTGLNESQALQELVQERRVALVFRGLSFYDSRRWGWTYSVDHGGGSYGNVLVTPDLVVHNNVLINYDFLDYWDVPADESDLNPPSDDSAPLVNPN